MDKYSAYVDTCIEIIIIALLLCNTQAKNFTSYIILVVLCTLYYIRTCDSHTYVLGFWEYF